MAPGPEFDTCNLDGNLRMKKILPAVCTIILYCSGPYLFIGMTRYSLNEVNPDAARAQMTYGPGGGRVFLKF